MYSVATSSVRRWLAQTPAMVFIPYASLAAFIAYCCMYAMRKPFTAAQYEGQYWMGVHFKIVLVVSQVAGYAVSKFIGIRLISAMHPVQRGWWMVGLLSVALLALLGFALTPFPYNALWMFVNGLPLGMIWGIVFGYLEGRRVTEILAAALSVNFIVSSGFVWLLIRQSVPETWMPFVAGLLFLPLLLVSIWLLEQLPAPTAADKAARHERTPMNGEERRRLWRLYPTGFVLLIGVYLILTIIRDIRDNFAVEIWAELGFSGHSAILTTAELPVALLTLLGLGALMAVRNNFKALWIHHALTLCSAALLIASTFAFQKHWLSPVAWMVSSGLAVFVPYILFNGMLFDRLLASFRQAGNVGFLMYTADAIGYLGSVLILLWRNFGFGTVSWLDFYCNLCYVGAILLAVAMACSWYYFKQQSTRTPSALPGDTVAEFQLK
jgi:hypothetical protein